MLKLLKRRVRRNPNAWLEPKVDPMIPFDAPAINSFHGRRTAEEADRFVVRMRLMMDQRRPNQMFTGTEIAAFCGVSRQYVAIVEQQALHKLRAMLPDDFREALLA